MTLFRTSDIIMALLMLFAAFITYEVKYETQRRYQEVQRLERKIDVERDTAAILRARWALAAEPERLEQLAGQYHGQLGLEITQPRQIVTVKDIPRKLPDAIEIAIKDSEAAMAKGSPGGLDNVATGSVVRSGGQSAPDSRKNIPADDANRGDGGR